MKKILAILLVMALMVPMATFASAAENTMTLKTTVPAATYTLSIPTTLEIPFGAEEVEIPLPVVIQSSGFQRKDLRIWSSDVAFIGERTSSTYVDMDLLAVPYAASLSNISLLRGSHDRAMYFIFAEDDGCLDYEDCYMVVDGELELLDHLNILFEKDDWYKLEPGEHTGYIEFTSEVVPNIIEDEY